MFVAPYPIELKQRLDMLFKEKGNMSEAVRMVQAEFPEFRKRLTVTRAYPIVGWFRKHKPQAKKQIPWSLVPSEQQEKILRAAKKLHSDRVRWKVITERLQRKYPQFCIPAAVNLARLAGVGGTVSQDQKSSLAKHLVLQISNAGSLDFKAEINLDIARRVIQECLA